MEAASDEAKSERKVPLYVSDLVGLSTTVITVMDTYLPASHLHRKDLIKAAEVLRRLDDFAYGLWFTVEAIERMHLLTFGQQVDILDMAGQLKKRAATHAQGSRDRGFFTHAGELMDLWYSLSKDYDSLREASAQLRFCAPEERKPSG